MDIRIYNALRKIASLGLPVDEENITDKFADFYNQRTAQAVGAFGGVAGGLLGLGLASGKRRAKEKLPDFDPETGGYIGKAYKIPEDDEQFMQKLHRRIVGEDWNPSAPPWLDWLVGSRAERMRNAIRNSLKAGEGNTKGLSDAEIASIVFPYVLKKDKSVVRNLGFWHEFPIIEGMKSRGITNADIQKYLDNHKKKEDKDK